MNFANSILILCFALTIFATVRSASDYSDEDSRGDTEEANDDNVPLTPADFEAADSLSPDDLDDSSNGRIQSDGPQEDPLTKAGKFEGDIQFPKGTNLWSYVDSVEFDNSGDRDDYGDEPQSSAVRGAHKIWPQGKIPYTISRKLPTSVRGLIAAAISEFQSNTCIRWVPRTNEGDYVAFRHGNGCYSEVGRTGGKQVISLDYYCFYKGLIVHEMMHAIGFFHEQSRADRDEYVEIRWANIKEHSKNNFMKYSLSKIDHLGTEYDCDSIMHYSSLAFAKSGRISIWPKARSCYGIGQRKKLSTLDKLDINTLYSCDKETGGLVPGVTGTCKDTNTYCAAWARAGYCSSYSSYMDKTCANSCNACRSGPISDCDDSDGYCGAWASAGHCSGNPGYMRNNCKKACGLCQTADGPKACVDTVESCDTLEAASYCTNPKFKAFMEKFCEKTCGFCVDIMGTFTNF